jgi:capsular exopolysaccharide synthesis family protein
MTQGNRNALRGAAGDVPAGNPAVGNTHLLDYLRLLSKRRRTVAVVFVVVVAVTAYRTYSATPIYEAPVQLLIEHQPNVFTLQDGVSMVQDREAVDYYQTQHTILRSRRLARKSLDALKLWDDPELGGAAAPEEAPAPSLLDRVRAMLGWPMRAVAAEPSAQAPTSPATEAPGADETAAQSNTIDAFLSRLTVTPVKNSRLVDVSFRSTRPEVAAAAANAVAEAYIAQNLEFKFLASKEASDWLREQLAEQRRRVEESENALQRYRESSDAISLEDRQNIVVQKLADLNSIVTKAKTDRIEKEALYQQLERLRADQSALDTFPLIQSNAYMQQLKTELAALHGQRAQQAERLGDRHPEMIRLRAQIDQTEQKFAGELDKLVAAVRNDFQAAQTLEERLSAALDSQKNEALGLDRKRIEYSVLQREVTSNQQIFQSLLQRTRETGIAGEFKTSNVRIVDPAEVPQTPVWPNRPRNLALGMLLGATLGLGCALLFDYVDDRITTPEEIKSHLNLPFLGLVPLIAGSKDGGGAGLINNGVPASFSEAFRTVRTNVLFAAGADARTIVITSTGPGEGKTSVASNLALALALTGQRVLLADLDLRKPRLHDVFDAAPEPGFSDLLRGSADAQQAIQPTSNPALWLLTAGAAVDNPAELLSSNRFRDLLETLSRHFDWVLIDTPPVMAVTDAAIVAHSASAVLFVVGADLTSRATAANALELLDGADATFVGAILNRVNLDRDAFYYAQHYRREYSAYYGARVAQ